MARINNILVQNFPDFEFLPAKATGPGEAQNSINRDKNERIDGCLVYQMNCWNKYSSGQA